jgi:hypothetical protein
VGVGGRSGLLDSVPEGVDEGAIGGQLVHFDLHDEPLVSVVLKKFWRVVSVGVDLLSSGSPDELLHSNLLRLAC